MTSNGKASSSVWAVGLHLSVILTIAGAVAHSGRTFLDAMHSMTTLDCHERKYTFNMTSENCWGMVEVQACWGRCDSWEVGIPRPPYTERHHPICAYQGRKDRVVELKSCNKHAKETEMVVVSDATGCQCKTCNEFNSKCELH